jgi:energy-coupling factor transport system permease protein
MYTKFEDFTKALRKLGVPYTFAFSLGLAMRSLNYLTADVRNIMDSQRSRGLEMDKNSLKNPQMYLALFVPIIICLINRSKNIAEALQVKAFRHMSILRCIGRLSCAGWILGLWWGFWCLCLF